MHVHTFSTLTRNPCFLRSPFLSFSSLSVFSVSSPLDYILLCYSSSPLRRHMAQLKGSAKHTEDALYHIAETGLKQLHMSTQTRAAEVRPRAAID